MWLTGDADAPPLAPPTTAAVVLDAALAPFGLDAGVLGERAAHLGLVRSGNRSCGGSTCLLKAADGWAALALARPDDVASLPALFEVDPGEIDVDDPWQAVTALVAERPAAEVVDRAAMLGMAASRVGERRHPSPADGMVFGQGPARPRTRVREMPGGAAVPSLVVDLSALWAGPFCTHLLGRVGARVVKVESTTRPDGARAGVAGFHDLLNAGKESVALDVATVEGRVRLRDLVDAADVVVTSSRARAVEQLGLDPDAFLDGGTDRVWVAITGHGWSVDRVGFGDDAAAAAGLVAWGDDGRPRFAGDAVADPVCGALAASAALAAWQRGGRAFVDVSLAGAAAEVMPAELEAPVPATAADADGDGGWTLDGAPVVAPVAREPGGAAAALGADTDRVLGELLA